MADTTVLTPAQIAALADAGVVRQVVTTDSVVRAFKDDRITFYVSTPDTPGGAVPWVRIVNGAFTYDGPVAAIAGAGPGNAITNVEALALVAVLKKLHVGLVHP